MDQVFQPEPPPFTALFSQSVPALGGDTVFANAAAAYDLLDPQFAAYIETLTAVYDVETQGFLTLAYHDLSKRAAEREKYPPIEVPLVRVHPETGRKQIFANELYTHRVLGVTRRTSQALLDILFDALSAPEVQARHRWHDGTMARHLSGTTGRFTTVGSMTSARAVASCTARSSSESARHTHRLPHTESFHH